MHEQKREKRMKKINLYVEGEIMKERFVFEIYDRRYEIDNTAYDKKTKGTIFEIIECPKCHKFNSNGTEYCAFCKSQLSSKDIKLASWKPRWGLKVFITSLLWGVASAGIFGLRIHLGGVPTLMAYGLCMFVAGLISGNKVMVDNEASDAYWHYRALCAKQKDECDV